MLIGQSKSLENIKRLIKIAGTMRILFHGETGVGKTPLARYSNQQLGLNRPFELLNCAGLSRENFQDLLFGHKKGAFTGAITDKKGLVELANGGDLFLDEIGDMPLDTQALLLTFLDTQEYYPLGDDRKKKANVRILCATNRDLRAMIEKGTFRKDLYSRISQVVIHIPPLRERPNDIKPIFEHYIRVFTHQDKPYTEALLRFLENHSYKDGNVRELRDLTEYLCTLGHDAHMLDIEHLGQKFHTYQQNLTLHNDDWEVIIPEGGLEEFLDLIEKKALAVALKDHEGSRTKVAEALKMSRPTLYRKLRYHRLTK